MLNSNLEPLQGKLKATQAIPGVQYPGQPSPGPQASLKLYPRNFSEATRKMQA